MDLIRLAWNIHTSAELSCSAGWGQGGHLRGHQGDIWEKLAEVMFSRVAGWGGGEGGKISEKSS